MDFKTVAYTIQTESYTNKTLTFQDTKTTLDA